MQATLDRLKGVLLKTYPGDPDTVTLDQSLEALGVDSLGIGLLLFDVEDEFKIKFTSDPGPLRTVGDVVKFIDEMVTSRSDHELAAEVHALHHP